MKGPYYMMLLLVAAAAKVALHIHTGSTVPRLTFNGIGVVVCLRLVLLTGHLHVIVSIEGIDTIALEDNLLSASGDK